MSANALAGRHDQPEGQQPLPADQNTPPVPESNQLTPQPAPQPVQTPIQPEAEKLPDGSAEFVQAQKDGSETVKQFGLEPEAIETEWFSNGGKLTEDTYKVFESKGISRAMVDNYGKMLEQGQKQQTQSQQQKIIQAEQAYISAVDAHTGGREKTAELMLFLSSGAIPANEQQALFQQLDIGDVETAKIAMNRIKTLHEGRYGREGRPLNGGDLGHYATGDIFNTGDEALMAYTACDRGDPRQTQMRRDQVMAKLTKTNQMRAARGQAPLKI